MIKRLVLFVSSYVWTWTFKKETSCSVQLGRNCPCSRIQTCKTQSTLAACLEPQWSLLPAQWRLGMWGILHSTQTSKWNRPMCFNILRSVDRNQCQYVDTIIGTTKISNVYCPSRWFWVVFSLTIFFYLEDTCNPNDNAQWIWYKSRSGTWLILWVTQTTPKF